MSTIPPMATRLLVAPLVALFGAPSSALAQTPTATLNLTTPDAANYRFDLGFNASSIADSHGLLGCYVSVAEYEGNNEWHNFLNTWVPAVKHETVNAAELTAAIVPSHASTLHIPTGTPFGLPPWIANATLDQLTTWSDTSSYAKPFDEEGEVTWPSDRASWPSTLNPEPYIDWPIAQSKEFDPTDFDRETLVRALIARQLSIKLNTSVPLDDPAINQMITHIINNVAVFNLNVVAMAVQAPTPPATKPIVTISLGTTLRIILPDRPPQPDYSPMYRLPVSNPDRFAYLGMDGLTFYVETSNPIPPSQLPNLQLWFPATSSSIAVAAVFAGASESIVGCTLPTTAIDGPSFLIDITNPTSPVSLRGPEIFTPQQQITTSSFFDFYRVVPGMPPY